MFLNRDPHKPYLGGKEKTVNNAKYIFIYWCVLTPFALLTLTESIFSKHHDSLTIRIFNFTLGSVMLTYTYFRWRKAKRDNVLPKEKETDVKADLEVLKITSVYNINPLTQSAGD